MTAALWFTFGVLSGASSLLAGLLLIPARRTLPAAAPVEGCAVVEALPTCGCEGCQLANTVYGLRLLPEATR